MAVVRVRVEGLKRARDKLGRFASGVDEKPLRILLEEAPRIEAEAKLETPVESGDLRRSVTVSVNQSERRASLQPQSYHSCCYWRSHRGAGVGIPSIGATLEIEMGNI